MEAALLRLNPQLSQIGDLEQGTPIVVPDGFALAPDRSTPPARGLAEALLQRAESALADLRATIKEQAQQQAARAEQAQAWLKSDQAKELSRQSPQLKELFSAATSAVKSVPKGVTAVVAAEDKALAKVGSQLANFRAATLGTNASATRP